MGNMCTGWVQGVLDTLRDKLDIMRDKTKGEEVAMDTKKGAGEEMKKEEAKKEKDQKLKEKKDNEKKENKEKEQKEKDQKEKEKKEKQIKEEDQKEKEQKEKEQKEKEKHEKQMKEKEQKDKEKKEKKMKDKEQKDNEKKEKEKKEKEKKEKEKKEKEKREKVKKNKKSADADTSMTGLRGVATTFTLSGEAGQEAWVAGSFSAWERIRLERREDGVLSAVVELEPGSHQYKFLVDGEWRLDPSSGEATVDNGLGSCNNVITVQREQLVQ